MFFFRAYGDMYSGLPTLYFSFSKIFLNNEVTYECFLAKPKSAMMALPSLRKMLANLRSLCK
jgi:hypothetical protein